jgi:P pilus assembly chaperone PapD
MLNKTKKLPTFIKTTLSTIALSALFLFPSSVKAQVGVSPMIIEAETKQGQATGVITLSNTGRSEAHFRLYAQPFTYNEEGFQVLEVSEDDLTPYLVFSPTEVIIQPGEIRRIRLVARFLPSTPEGEYRAVIFSEPLVDRANQSGLAVNSRIGTTVYVRHGDIAPRLNVEGANYDPQKSSINLVVNNSGDATVRPRVRWRLLQGNQTIAENEISEITIIAEGGRNIPLRIEGQNIPSGNYTVRGELIWGNFYNPQTQPFDVEVRIP